MKKLTLKEAMDILRFSNAYIDDVHIDYIVLVVGQEFFKVNVWWQ